MSRFHILSPLAACVLASGLIATTGAQRKGEHTVPKTCPLSG
jgi:hypothetical protein